MRRFVPLLLVVALASPAGASELETSVRTVLGASEIAVPERSRSFTHLAETTGCGTVPAHAWHAEPTWIGGSGRWQGGEFVWTDLPYDDGGTGNLRYPGDGEQLVYERNAVQLALEREGRVGRVTPRLDRYGGSAADVVELRAAVDGALLHVLVAFNFMNATDAVVVGLGFDHVPDAGSGDWPLGAKLKTPGLDTFVTLHGTCGVVGDSTPLDAAGGAIVTDTVTNTMHAAIPLALFGGAASVRMVGGSGVWDPAAGTWKAPVQGGQNRNATDDVTGASTADDPAVFNLLFRDDELFVDLNDVADTANSNSGPRVHQTQRQQEVLAGGTSGPYGVTLPLDAPPPDTPVPVRRGDDVAFTRVYRSRVDLEGIVWDAGQPVYLGRHQPYAVWLPSCFEEGCTSWGAPGSRPPLVLSMHGGDGSHVNELSEEAGLRQASRFDTETGGLFVAPLGRGRRNPWWRGLGEVDALEVLHDARTRYATDRERQAIAGASLGGYATYRLGSVYPDLWAGAAAHCPAPYENSLSDRTPGQELPSTQTFEIDPLLRNLTNVPLVQVSGTGDPIERFTSGWRLRDRALAQGLALRYTEYPLSSHCFLLPAFQGGWMDNHMLELIDMVRLGRVVSPSRVRYAVDPRHYPEATEVIGSYDVRDVGVRFDGAYWVSGVRLRDDDPGELGVFAGGNAPQAPGEEVVGWIDVTSHARGGGTPSVSSCGEGAGLAGLYGGNPRAEPDTGGSTGMTWNNPHLFRCQALSWSGEPQAALDLSVVRLAAATIDAAAAGLDDAFTIRAIGDGAFTLLLDNTAAAAASGPCVMASSRDGDTLAVSLVLHPSVVCTIDVA